MICPSCAKANSLTWKRYCSAPTGRHRCEHCKAQFRMAHTVRYYLCILLLGLFSAAPTFFLATYLGASFNLAVIYAAAVALLILVPADKSIDNSWRGTRAIP